MAEVFASQPGATMPDRLTEAQTAFANVNSGDALTAHAQLRTRRMSVRGGSGEVPASPWGVEWQSPNFPDVLALEAHGRSIRAEFGNGGRGGAAGWPIPAPRVAAQPQG